MAEERQAPSSDLPALAEPRPRWPPMFDPPVPPSFLDHRLLRPFNDTTKPGRSYNGGIVRHEGGLVAVYRVDIYRGPHRVAVVDLDNEYQERVAPTLLDIAHASHLRNRPVWPGPAGGSRSVPRRVACDV